MQIPIKTKLPPKNKSTDNIMQQFKAQLNSLTKALSSRNGILKFSVQYTYHNFSKCLIVIIDMSSQ